MSLSDSFGFINEFVAKRSEEVNQSLFGASNRSAASAQGQMDASTNERVVAPAMDQVESNPIVNMGVDVANEVFTTVTQQLIVTSAKRVEAFVNEKTGIPVRKTLQDVMDGYFTVVGLVSTATVEVEMELARLNARAIIGLIAKKEELIKLLQEDITKLYNAMNIIMNSQAFFTDYFQKLLSAYTQIDSSNKSLKSVVSVLKLSNRYNQTQYNRAISQLEEARDLILPDRTAQIDEIQNSGLLNNTLSGKQAKDALAAAQTIPAIAAGIGDRYFQYVRTVVQINALIEIFLNSLQDFINAYQQNENLNSNTISHITAGTGQLDSLLKDMRVMLFPTDGREKQVSYPAQVTTSATMWGLRLAPVIEWLKIQPGLASKELEITGESVTRYNKSIADLNAIGDITIGLATLRVVTAKEDLKDTTVSVGRLLLDANTAITGINITDPKKPPLFAAVTPATAKAKVVQLGQIFDASKLLDVKITSALQPFIDTPFELLEGADKVVKQMIKLTDDLGLDRASDALRKGDLSSVLNMDSNTATTVGAAAAGVGLILSQLLASPNTTDREAQNMARVKDGMDRQSDVKKVESTRSAAASIEPFKAKQQQLLANDTRDANLAAETAKKLDPEIPPTPIETAQNIIGKAVGDRFKSLPFF